MKKVLAAMTLVIFVLSLASTAIAGESHLKKDATAAGKKTAKYSKNVVTGSVNTVGEAAYGTTKAAMSPFQAMWNWMTGKDEAKKMVTDPINKTGTTVHDAAINTGKTIAGKKK
ncbi:MAG: hypothetical protein GF392_02985 [Candidatus Omnitrophica bacterium]|nr:hypothetical protein [Candidatus Omnitrophota bacterium]